MKLKVEQATKAIVVLGFYTEDDRQLSAFSFPPELVQGVKPGDEFKLVKVAKKAAKAPKFAKKKARPAPDQGGERGNVRKR